MVEKIKVTLKDGSVREYDKGVSVAEVAKSLSQKLAKTALVGKVNGKLVDLGHRLESDAEVGIFDFNSQEGKDALRHSAAHVMAQAVAHLYQNVKFGIGPAIANGFYYDFDLDYTFTPGDLEKIEREMQRIVQEDYPFQREELSRQEALKLFRTKGELYKVELIEGLPEDAVISIYKQGDFLDLCAGPHVVSTGRLKALKLQNLAGAYWRGDAKRKMLQRIYGTAFEKQAELEAYITMLEEAEKRDHRKLGREFDLFSMQEEGPGFPFFHPKGMIVRNELESFWRNVHRKWGYSEIKTPIILRQEMWQQSGHWDHYRENMYFTTIDGEGYAVKPMNCPGGMLVYK
ncbi:MAG: TGS domain-containing protein, partial [Bacillota bacterium]